MASTTRRCEDCHVTWDKQDDMAMNADDDGCARHVHMLVPRSLCCAYGSAIGLASFVGDLIALGNMHTKGNIGELAAVSFVSLVVALAFACQQGYQWVRFGGGTQEDEGVARLFACVMIVFNSQSQVALNHSTNSCLAHVLRASSLPGSAWTRSWAWVSAVGWLLRILLSCLFVPASWPCSKQHAYAQLSAFLSLVVICSSTAVMLGDLGFLDAHAHGMTSLVLCGITFLTNGVLHWLATSDGAGCRIAVPVLVVLTLGRVVRTFWIVGPSWWCMWNFGASLAVFMLAALATETPDLVCSTAPVFTWEPTVVKFLACGCLTEARQKIKDFLPTWRCAVLAHCLNSMLSLLIYGPLWADVQYLPDEGPHEWQSRRGGLAARQVGILVMSFVALYVSSSSLLTDRWREREGWTGTSWFRFLPIDRHFRSLVALKCGIACAKVDLLLSFSTGPAQHVGILTLQLISITTTAALASWNTIKMHSAALDTVGEFGDVFRFPAALLRISTLATIMWYVIVGVLLVVVAVSRAQSQRVPRYCNIFGVFVMVNVFWLVANNELVLLISSKLSSPRVFAALQSPTVLKAILAFIAVVQPYQMFCDFCDHVDEGGSDFVLLSAALALSAW
eukprot:CAMPEP_0198531260 /NCGR_PEP_ID=MMETSP1462-20131121/26837_1 /TAXON_ID=1333877 /ORGANISM="Brandtodinium nutriculum, Strain RCC3387" /LENGTH=619 /DNA_ID=CAMNT_0044261151 /DNA_START=65 /DNA_END=1921 /DNA_ORIENTATION=-